MRKLLVLGIGNSLLTDDGVGVLAAQTLQQEPWPEGVTVMDGGTFTQDIFYLFQDYDELLVLDVIHAGHAPGTLYTLTEDDLVANEKQRMSIHDIDMVDSLKMCELKNGRRPRMRIVGMEPHDITSWNIGLSAPCQAAFDDFLSLVRKEITQLFDSMRTA